MGTHDTTDKITQLEQQLKNAKAQLKQEEAARLKGKFLISALDNSGDRHIYLFEGDIDKYGAFNCCSLWVRNYGNCNEYIQLVGWDSLHDDAIKVLTPVPKEDLKRLLERVQNLAALKVLKALQEVLSEDQ